MVFYKRCTKCNKRKEVSFFWKDCQKKDGYASSCKDCHLIRRRSKEGLIKIIYDTQVSNSKKRNYNLPLYTKKELINWCLNQEIFHILYNNWIKSDYNHNLSPSIDRLNDYKSYTFNNIQLVTWDENNKKQYLNKIIGKNNKNSKKVYMYSLSGKYLKSFYSINKAMRSLNISQSSISKAIKKGFNYNAGGYIWRIKSSNKKDIIIIDNKKTSKKIVLQYNLQGDFIKEYDSLIEAENKTNISFSAISCNCLGKTKTSGGYIWKFKKI